MSCVTKGVRVVNMGLAPQSATLLGRDVVVGKGGCFAEAVLAGPQAMITGGVCPLFCGTTESGDGALAVAELHELLGEVGPTIRAGAIGTASMLMQATMLMLHVHVQSFAVSTSLLDTAGIPHEVWHAVVKGGAAGHPADFLVDFAAGMHFGPRDYTLAGPCQHTAQNAHAELAVIASTVKGAGLDCGLVDAEARVAGRMAAAGPDRCWTSVFEVVCGRNSAAN
jgi:3-hydroxyisobutyrate dehydrogenase-like beta-hydroxyacid dehydrogenase